MTDIYKGYCALPKERGEKRLENEKRAPRGQQVDFLTPEKAPAKIYGVLWWAALYTALTVGAELALDAVWTDRAAHWPAVLPMATSLRRFMRNARSRPCCAS